jgi:hypothetical protein
MQQVNTPNSKRMHYSDGESSISTASGEMKYQSRDTAKLVLDVDIPRRLLYSSFLAFWRNRECSFL